MAGLKKENHLVTFPSSSSSSSFDFFISELFVSDGGVACAHSPLTLFRHVGKVCYSQS